MNLFYGIFICAFTWVWKWHNNNIITKGELVCEHDIQHTHDIQLSVWCVHSLVICRLVVDESFFVRVRKFAKPRTKRVKGLGFTTVAVLGCTMRPFLAIEPQTLGCEWSKGCDLTSAQSMRTSLLLVYLLALTRPPGHTLRIDVGREAVQGWKRGRTCTHSWTSST